MGIMTYQCWDLSLAMLVKGALGVSLLHIYINHEDEEDDVCQVE